MEEFRMLIDGQLVSSKQQLPVINPASAEVLAQCPRADIDMVDRAPSRPPGGRSPRVVSAQYGGARGIDPRARGRAGGSSG